jgi:tripartite-type tricarboxylate transporter receptor subunit TctC
LVQINPNVLVVSASSPYQNLDDFLANIKSDPGGLRFSHTGAGSIYFFGIHQLLKASGSGGDAAVAVPYKGGSKSMAELLRGEVDFHPTNLVSAFDFIKTGAVRAGGYNERAP